MSDARKSRITFVETVKGNSADIVQGTWMHHDLALEFSKEFLDALASVRKSHSRNFEPYTTIPTSPEHGGGTWMHRDVALEFARWLSPLFAI